MKSKGFTLIELLAVIVILAIIAMIATPIILNIINKSKDQATVRSAELYLANAQLSIAKENMHNELNATKCAVKENGYLDCGGKEIKVEMDRTTAKGGKITFEKGKVIIVENLEISGKYCNKSANSSLVCTNDKPEKEVTYAYLITGDAFRTKLSRISSNTMNYFKRATSLPEGFVEKDENVISTAGSEIPAYIWYDSTSKTVYYYTEAEKLSLNEDSSYMFAYQCMALELDLSDFDTSNVTNMKGMFTSCESLESLNLSSFDTSNVTNMERMFYYCSGLTSLDLSSFDTSNVTNMAYMFAGDGEDSEWGFQYTPGISVENLDLSNFDTSKVTNMKGMFAFCDKTKTINLSGFDTSNVTDMAAMFLYCSSLESLNLSSFDTSNVTNMKVMFSHTPSDMTIKINANDKEIKEKLKTGTELSNTVNFVEV